MISFIQYYCDYKLYKFGKEDIICNQLFGQDLEFIADVPKEIATNDKKLLDFVRHAIKDLKAQYVLVERVHTPFMPEDRPLVQPARMIYCGKVDPDSGQVDIFIDGVDHDHQQKFAAYLFPKGIRDKVGYLRRKLGREDINDWNYTNFIEEANRKHFSPKNEDFCCCKMPISVIRS